MSRTVSRHVVRVFDPSRDPSVAGMLKDEQARDPKVTSVKAGGRYGLVTAPKGTYCLDEGGLGPLRPIDKLGVPIPFHRHFEERPGHDVFEPHAFMTATYSLAECEACATGEELTLDGFVSSAGAGDDRRFEAWGKLLG